MNMNRNNCHNYPIIPQFGGTCWFNVIITACCYSQYLKELFQLKSITWNSNSNSFLKYLKTILKYSYSNDIKIKKMFFKEKPEYILLKYLNNYDKDLKNIMKKMIHYYLNDISLLVYYNINYIIKFFSKIGISCLDIIILDNGEYLIDFDKNIELILKIKKNNQKDYSFTIDKDYKYQFKSIKFQLKKEIKPPQLLKIPEVIVIQPSNSFKHPSDKDLYKYTTKGIKFNSDLNSHLYYNGLTYNLDACILQNYNMKNLNHIILGFTCNNERYIYNSFNVNSNLKFKKICGFYKFNWNINKNDEFYFDYDKCKLKKINDKNRKNIEDNHQAFSFNKSNRILIYVKDNNQDSYKSLSHKQEMINSFYDIKNIPFYNLKVMIQNLGYSSEYIKGKTKEFLLELLEKKLKVL